MNGTAILVTGYWYLPPLLGALPLGFNIKISLKVSMDIEQITRIFCYYIHMERSKKLS
jgi:hypothetical protein